MPGRKFVAQLVRNESGGIAIVFGLTLVLMLSAIGMAVDVGRAYTFDKRISAALDAAALAGAKMLADEGATDDEIKAKAAAFFGAQLNGHAGTTHSGFAATLDRSASTVTTAVNASLLTTFARVVGVDTLSFSKTSTVVYKMKKVELAMALDITGSMSDVPSGDTVSKIDSLKTAAKEAVDTLFDQAVNDSGIRIALAPHSASVNPGAYGSAATGAWPYSGCVVERSGSTNTTDAAPTGSSQLTPLAGSSAGSGPCPASEVTALVGRSQRASLKSKIDNYTPTGNTAGHIGTAWAWYLVSPSWGGVFTGASAPNPYNAGGDIVKNVVIMTDGLFNTSYLSGASPSSASAINESYAQFDALCANMKAAGVVVYTIGFGLTDSRAISELQGCASGAGNFFSAADGAQLRTAFMAIVDRLNALRISR